MRKLVSLRIVKLSVIGLIMMFLVFPVFAQGTTRVTFSHEESFSWGNTRTSGRYTVNWNLTITGSMSFPVDFNVYNNEAIEPASDDEINYKLITPENEGEITITTIGYINVTIENLVTYTGQVENTTSLSVTTPLGEWETSIQIPIPVPVGPFIVTVTIVPTLYINASITANATVQGPATISKTELLWETNGHVETVTVHSSSEAQNGDEIAVTVKDISYDWNASITVGLKLEGEHLITSPPYQFETRSLPADGNPAIPFNIQVIPEFTSLALIITFILITSAVFIAKRKRLHKN